MLTNSEELFQIMELTMDITANSNWGTHLLNIWFLNQNFLCLTIKITTCSTSNRGSKPSRL